MNTERRSPKIVVLVDDDGDEFPLWRYPYDNDEDVLTRGRVFVTEGGWSPNGLLRFRQEEIQLNVRGFEIGQTVCRAGEWRGGTIYKVADPSDSNGLVVVIGPSGRVLSFRPSELETYLCRD